MRNAPHHPTRSLVRGKPDKSRYARPRFERVFRPLAQPVAQLVRHKPGRVVARQFVRQEQSRHAALVLPDQPCRREPFAQRRAGAVQDRHGSHRMLPPAVGTFENPLNQLCDAEPDANRALRPAARPRARLNPRSELARTSDHKVRVGGKQEARKMAEFPWQSHSRAAPERDYLALLSYLPLNSGWSIPRLLLYNARIRRQLRTKCRPGRLLFASPPSGSGHSPYGRTRRRCGRSSRRRRMPPS